MHYYKQCNDLIQSEINDKNSENFVLTTTDAKRNANCETTLSFEVNTRDRNTTKQHNGASDIETYKETTTSSTSSTDSGVNISDSDEIPPSPTSSNLHSFPSTTSSSSETTTLNLLNKQFHKNYKNTNRDNNKNNNKDNEYNNYNFNCDNDDDYDDRGSNNSFDNKLKVEQHRKQLQHLSQQQILKSSNGGNNTRYQPNQNIIESENVINISQQKILTTATPTVTLATNNNDTATTLQHNEFISRPQRSASTSSSLSMSSSNTNNYDHNPLSKMHHSSGSPVVSIRSINSSTVITSDSDSDSDLNDDIEGVHENYVIKKLGTQMSYPPNHPNIPNINSGHTVLNQKVISNENQVPSSPLAALAAIGDSIGAAQALGPVTSFSAVAQRPQIGSIALSNSSDVTFGDKHFYEGPVTIQQFLIDGRDKWKEANGKDNPTFVNENGETNDAKDINSSPEQLGKRKTLIIFGVLAILAFLIVAIVLGSKALNNSKSKLVLGNSEELRNNIPINSTIDTIGSDANNDSKCSGNGTLCLIDRDVWRAHPQKNTLDKQDLPLHRVIISHTATDTCDSIKFCTERVRIIQEFHMDSFGWDDIGYNFLIGSDGRVYIGRGWDAIGAHTKAQDNVGGGYVLRIVPRDGWLAQPSINDLIPLNHPVQRVIVIPTRTSECETQAACTYTVRITQTFNIESQQQDDIIYNFLIGGDGNVYEGRGWDYKGSVLKGFNDDSISFAYIGSFKKQSPSYKQLNVTRLLLHEGVRLNKLSPNYRIVGANKLDPTSVVTLADALYKSFENWPHWSDK